MRINSLTKALLFAASPHYCFASGVWAVAQSGQDGGIPLPPFVPGAPKGPLDWDVSVRPLVHMAIQVCVCEEIRRN